jgi:hypothetical protein
MNLRHIAALAGLVVMLSSIQAPLGSAQDDWSDDFDQPGLRFDPRWESGGLGQAYPFNGTYAEAVSYTTEETADWHGPWLRTSFSPSADFNVTVRLDCIADYDKETRGRLEVRLLGLDGEHFYALGWEDTELTNQYAAVNLKGESDALLFSSGSTVKYTIFSGKRMSISRESGVTRLWVEGGLTFEPSTSPKALAGLQICFFKHELDCTPTYMRVDSISVATAPASTPSPPLALTGSTNDGCASLSWTAPADGGGLQVIGYSVYRKEGQQGMEYLTSVAEPRYDDTGLTNGIEYAYQVRAVNDMGEGLGSIELTLIPRGPPGSPRDLQAIAGADYVILSWLPPLTDGGSPLTGYILYKNGAPTTLEPDAAGYNDTGLSPALTYTYTVSAVNAMGEGPAPADLSAEPGSGQHLPMHPRGLRAHGGDALVTLTWEPPASNGNSLIANYTVYRGTSAGTGSLLARLGVAYQFNDADVTNGQTYYYSVTATNGVGEGPATGEAAAAPSAPAHPTEPMQMETSVNGTSCALRWQAPLSDGGSPLLGYRVYRGEGAGPLQEIARLGNVLSFSDTGLAPSATYSYAISAFNSVGEGPMTEEQAVTVNATDPLILDPDSGGLESEINLNSTIVTAVFLAATLVGLLIFVKMSRRSRQRPDDAVDDEAQDDSAEEKGGN